MLGLNRFRDRKLDGENYLSVQQNEVEPAKQNEKATIENLIPQSSALAPSQPSQYGTLHAIWQCCRHYFNDGWRGQMIRVSLLSTLIWIIIIIIYIVLFAAFGSTNGSGTLMTGTCHFVQRTNSGIHAVLNVFTSLMLSASNFAMESLCCPTREEIDTAHAHKKWFGIGGLRLRNFRFVGKARLILWILLVITSAPLHLFFNAVFFTSSRTYQYSVAVVTPDFFNTTTWSPMVENSAPSNFDALGGYADVGEYERSDNATIVTLLDDARGSRASLEFLGLDPAQCMSTYANGFVQSASDVVVVASSTLQSSDPLIWTRYPERTVSRDGEHTNQDPYNWICHDALQNKVLEEARIHDYCTIELVNELTKQLDEWTVYDGHVQYCLSRPQEDQCSLFFNVWLMLAVILCGVIKTSVMIRIYLRYSRTPRIRSIGDAINSFLNREDQTTKDLCLVPSGVFVKTGLQPYEPQPCTNNRQRWWISAGVKQFWTTLVVTMLYIVIFSIALYFAVVGAAGGAFDFDIGYVNILALARVTRDSDGSSEIVPNLIVANIPQMAFTFLYMLYNNLWSKIYLGIEFEKFRKRPKGLRVSEVRRGAQRGSRFFDLPVHWTLTIIAISATLHWLTSQALFLVRIDGVDNSGVIDPNDQLTRLGYNCRAITGIICVLLVVLIATFCLGWFRKFEIGFGEIGNSLVISAACHPPHSYDQDADMGTKEVSWGDVTVDGEVEGSEVRHASFAPIQPRRLIVGAYYA